MSLRATIKRQGYELYRHVAPPLFRLRDVDIHADHHSPALQDLFTGLLEGSSPVYFGRIGGCEYDAASAYYRSPKAFAKPSGYLPHLERVQALAGYFDFDHEYANFARFLEQQVACYANADVLLYCNSDLITKFRYNVFMPGDMPLLRRVCSGKTLIDFTFAEAVAPFLRSFKVWGEGKRILIVSPFSRSLRLQYSRLNELLVDYEFPRFELLTYTSPVTWSTAEDTPASMHLESRNWHQECDKMRLGINELDFDVALLSCGSYAAAVGDHIRHQMNRSAIYLGGILNVIFNIYGPRYDTPFFNGFMRSETQIEALENEDVQRLRGGRSSENEAMRAYFGARPR